MSEDGDWFAFPAEWSRGQVIGAIAATGDGWWGALRSFRFSLGYARPWLGDDDGEDGWWFPCDESHPHARLVWHVERR